eukprot:NODE_479_length_6970_cov_0.750982.p3 type:complete len:289 gc:universal NODE_479_length_6970_cov_0.750982:5874-5008(-)
MSHLIGCKRLLFNIKIKHPSLCMLFYALSFASCSGSSSGKATFYDSENGYGNCGSQIPNKGLYVAISKGCYSESVCGKQIKVSYQGKSVVLPVLDSCPSCDSDHIDISRDAFAQIANLDAGVIQVSWEMVGGSAQATPNKSSPSDDENDVRPKQLTKLLQAPQKQKLDDTSNDKSNDKSNDNPTPAPIQPPKPIKTPVKPTKTPIQPSPIPKIPNPPQINPDSNDMPPSHNPIPSNEPKSLNALLKPTSTSKTPTTANHYGPTDSQDHYSSANHLGFGLLYVFLIVIN